MNWYFETETGHGPSRSHFLHLIIHPHIPLALASFPTHKAVACPLSCPHNLPIKNQWLIRVDDVLSNKACTKTVRIPGGKRSVGRIASFALQLASEARECCDAVQMHMNLYVPHQALWVTKTWTNNLPKTSLHSGRYHPSHTVLCYPCCFWCHAGPLHPSILLSDYIFDRLRMSPNSQGFREGR